MRLALFFLLLGAAAASPVLLHWFDGASAAGQGAGFPAATVTCVPPASLTLDALVDAATQAYSATWYRLVLAALGPSRAYVVMETTGASQVGTVSARALFGTASQACWTSHLVPVHTTSAGEQTSGVDAYSLDRLDQRHRGGNGKFGYIGSGQHGPRVFILDTGIYTAHAEFGGRAHWYANTIDSDDTDGHGHGTHVASLAGGATYGTSKSVPLYAIKVLNSGGSGTDVSVALGIQHVEALCVAAGPSSTARFIISMSLQGGASSVMDDAIASIFAACPTTVVIVAAAGNSASSSCDNSPGGTEGVLTVAASDATLDILASFSNYGDCVEIAGPGVLVLGASIASATASVRLSGTSMSTPLVSGLMADFFEYLGVNGTRATVTDFLLTRASKSKLSNSPLPLAYSQDTLDARGQHHARKTLTVALIALWMTCFY